MAGASRWCGSPVDCGSRPIPTSPRTSSASPTSGSPPGCRPPRSKPWPSSPTSNRSAEPRWPPCGASTWTAWSGSSSTGATSHRWVGRLAPARPCSTPPPTPSWNGSAWTGSTSSPPSRTCYPGPRRSPNPRSGCARSRMPDPGGDGNGDDDQTPATLHVGERLQKVLARSGVGSRRVCEDLIVDGRVTVNGEVPVLGRRVDPEVDVIELDGVPLPVRPGLVHYLVNKPAGVVSTAEGTHGRATLGVLRGRHDAGRLVDQVVHQPGPHRERDPVELDHVDLGVHTAPEDGDLPVDRHPPVDDEVLAHPPRADAAAGQHLLEALPHVQRRRRLVVVPVSVPAGVRHPRPGASAPRVRRAPRARVAGPRRGGAGRAGPGRAVPGRRRWWRRARPGRGQTPDPPV